MHVCFILDNGFPIWLLFGLLLFCLLYWQIVFEDVFSARDPATLEHLKELSSRRRVIEESINQSSFITEAIAREMSGGLTSQCLRVIS